MINRKIELIGTKIDSKIWSVSGRKIQTDNIYREFQRLKSIDRLTNGWTFTIRVGLNIYKIDCNRYGKKILTPTNPCSLLVGGSQNTNFSVANFS